MKLHDKEPVAHKYTSGFPGNTSPEVIDFFNRFDAVADLLHVSLLSTRLAKSSLTQEDLEIYLEQNKPKLNPNLEGLPLWFKFFQSIKSDHLVLFFISTSISTEGKLEAAEQRKIDVFLGRKNPPKKS